jgi:ubiquinone/menaquinone biosynthesis C-methylase UbiE
MNGQQQESEISRVTRSKAEAQKAYDRLSRGYDLLAGGSERPLAQIGLRLLNVKPGERVLEIGYGTGHALLAMARAVGEKGQVFGLDISTGMSRVARQRLSRDGSIARVQLICGDGAWLPLAGGWLDAIFLSFTLELLDACRRVLRPGGRISVVSLSKAGRNTPMLRLYEWAHRKFPAAVDCRPIYTRRELERAGLQVVENVPKRMWGLPVEICLARKG